MLGQKKVVLFPEIGRVKIFVSLTRPQSRMYIRIYIFNYQIKKIMRQKKAKETKEEKITFVENLTGYDDISCEFALSTFNLLDRVVNFSWVFI